MKANDYNNEPCLNVQKWAEWRRRLLTTGTYDPNCWDELDRYQKDWTKDALNTMKEFNKK